MAMFVCIESYGFEFVLTTLVGQVGVAIDISDKKIAHAIQSHDPGFLAALEKLARDAEEIECVMLAEENFSLWQSYSVFGKKKWFKVILESEYASEKLKNIVREELYPTLRKPKPPSVKPPKVPRSGYVYLVLADTGEYKIGYSSDVEKRIKVFSTQPPFDYTLTHTFPVDDMYGAEAILHTRFSQKRIKGEWFSLNDEDVKTIKQISEFKDGKFIENSSV